MNTKKLKNLKLKVSIIALIMFCINLIPLPKTASANSMLGAVRNQDGTVTISVAYDGDELYLVGSMTGWAAENDIPMIKISDGIFEVTDRKSVV